MMLGPREEAKLLNHLSSSFPGSVIIGECGSRMVYSAAAVRERIRLESDTKGRFQIFALASDLHIPIKAIKAMIADDFPELVATSEGMENGEVLTETYIETMIIGVLDDLIKSKGKAGASIIGLASHFEFQVEFFREIILKRALNNASLKKSIQKKNGSYYNLNIFEDISGNIIEICSNSSDQQIQITDLAKEFNLDIADVIDILSKGLKDSSLLGEIYANNSIFIPQKFKTERRQRIQQQLMRHNCISVSLLRSNCISNCRDFLLPIVEATGSDVFLVQFANTFVDSAVIIALSQLFQTCNGQYFDPNLPESVTSSRIDSTLIEIEELFLNHRLDIDESEYFEIVAFCLLEDIGSFVSQYFTTHHHKDSRITTTDDIIAFKNSSSNNSNSNCSNSSSSNSSSISSSNLPRLKTLSTNSVSNSVSSACKSLEFMKSFCDGKYIINMNCVHYLAKEVVFESLREEISKVSIDVHQKKMKNNGNQVEIVQKSVSEVLNPSRIHKILTKKLSQSKFFKSLSSTSPSSDACDDEFDASFTSASSSSSRSGLKACLVTLLKENVALSISELLAASIFSLSHAVDEYRDSLFELYWKQLILLLKSLAILEHRKADDVDKIITETSESFKRGELSPIARETNKSDDKYALQINIFHQNILLSKCLEIMSLLIRFSLYQSNALHLFQATSKKAVKNLNHMSIRDSTNFPLSNSDIRLIYANLPKSQADILILLLSFIPGSISPVSDVKSTTSTAATSSTSSSSNATNFSYSNGDGGVETQRLDGVDGCASTSVDSSEKVSPVSLSGGGGSRIPSSNSNVWNFVGVLYYTSSSLQLLCKFEKKRDSKSPIVNKQYQDGLQSCKNSVYALAFLTRSQDSPNIFSSSAQLTLSSCPPIVINHVKYVLIKVLSVYFSVVNTSCFIDPILLLRRFGIDDNNVTRAPTIPGNLISQDDENSQYYNISDNLLLFYSVLLQENSKKKKDRASRILVIISIFISANYKDMSEESDNNKISSTSSAECAIFQDWLDELSKEICSL